MDLPYLSSNINTMAEEDLNHSQEEEEKSDTKPDEGSDSEEMSDEEFEAVLNGEDDEEEESEEDGGSKDDSKASEDSDTFVEDYNEKFGTNFKNLEAIQESQKNLRKAASGKKDSPTAEPKAKGNFEDKFAEDLLLGRFPEAAHVLEELHEEAENTGKNVLDLYKSSSFIQKEAKVRAEESDVDTSNNKKINIPDAGTSAKTIDFSRMSSEQFKQYKAKVQSQA